MTYRTCGNCHHYDAARSRCGYKGIETEPEHGVLCRIHETEEEHEAEWAWVLPSDRDREARP